jgi:hypothetical protein
MTPRPTPPRVSMRLGELAPLVDARAEDETNEGRAQAMRVMVERYNWLVYSAARPRFSVPEWRLVCDALNGSMFRDRPDSLGFLWAQVADAITLNGADRKWEVDGPALVKRLRALTPGELIATVDVVERFWIEVGRGNQGAKVPGEVGSDLAPWEPLGNQVSGPGNHR